MKKIISLLTLILFLPSVVFAPVWPIKTRASQVRTNTSNFDNILSSTTTNTQKALDIFDDGNFNTISVLGTGVYSSVTKIVASTDSVHPNRADYQCNGTNDQVEINNAITEASVSSGTVKLLGGVFYTPASVEMKNGVALIGQGRGSVLKVPDGTDPADLRIVSLDNVTNCTLRDFAIDGNDTNNTGQMRGVHISSGSGHKIQTLWITEIEGSLVGIGGDGIYVSTWTAPTDILIRDCTVWNISDDGMDVNGMVESRIVDNYIGSCGDNAIDTEGAEYLSIANNTIEDCTGHGIELEQEHSGLTKYCSVGNNTLRDITQNAIHIKSGGYNSVGINTIETANIGVYLAKTTNGDNAVWNNILGNTLINCAYGIFEESGEADYNSLIENKFYNCVSSMTIVGTHTRAIYEGSSNQFIFNQYIEVPGVLDTSLTASKPVFTNGNKKLTTAGTLPIDQGGTGETGDVAAFNALAPTTTKGDIIVFDGSDNVRLPVGADNQVLISSSTTSTGLKWVAGGGGGGATTLLELTDTPVAYDNGKYLKSTVGDSVWDTPAGAGDVVGPASSNNNALCLFDGVTGKLIKQSVNADINATVGRVVLGYAATSDNATFSHIDHTAITNVGVRQSSTGALVLNVPTGLGIFFRVNNSSTGQMHFNVGGFKVGSATPDARFEVETGASEGHQAVTIDQNDIDKSFIDFQGYSEPNQTYNISTAQGYGDYEAPQQQGGADYGWLYEGMLAIEVNGTKMWIPYYSDESACCC